MIKVYKCIVVISIIGLLSCYSDDSSRVPTITEDDSVLIPVHSYLAKYMLDMQSNLSLASQDFIDGSSAEYLLDYDTITKDEYQSLNPDKLVFANSVMNMKSNLSKQSNYLDNKKHYILRSLTVSNYAFSREYYSDHRFTPTYVSLALDHLDLLGLTLQTQHTGPMQTVAFDIDSGEVLANYTADTYDGGYYLGLNVADHYFSEIGLIGVVGDSLFYTSFACEDL